MPQRTLKLVVAYDGTHFHGWQRQRGVRTVQEDLQDLARRVLHEPVDVVGASRTDAGVHARGQTAHVVTASAMPDRNVCSALRDRLPDDIALVHLTRVHDTFHAIRDARTKLYRYRVYNAARSPAAALVAPYAWHVWWPLDADAMRAAAAALVGTHDFAAFASSGCQRSTTVRTIRRFDVQRRFEEIWFDVEGDGFLYNQVRNMVGTLIEIGRGHWPAARLGEILAGRQRTLAGPTAPPHGLCLQWIRYEAVAVATSSPGPAP